MEREILVTGNRPVFGDGILQNAGAASVSRTEMEKPA